MADFSLRTTFGETLLELAKTNPLLYVVDIGLYPSLNLVGFKKRYPTRFIQAGISEANAAAVAAGLAKTGKTVFLTSFACFSPALNWGVIRQSICYNQANVKIIGSHAGLASGDLGATHQMLEDIALTKTLPHLQVFVPADALETKAILKVIAQSNLPSYLRLPRPSSPLVTKPATVFTIGRSRLLRTGTQLTIISYGTMVSALTTLKSLSYDLINCSSIKPLDSNLILASVAKTGRCLVVEDHQLLGGLGETIAALLLENGLAPRFKCLGVDNQFGRSSHELTPLYDHYSLGPDSINTTITNLISSK
jgi:transketolase